MANSRQATKRIRINTTKRAQNQTLRSDMRSAVKRVEAAVSNNDVEAAKEALAQAVKKIDKAVQKGILHTNNGNRRKSRLMKKVDSIAN